MVPPTSYMWLFTLQLSKIKNLVPWLHEPHFKCSTATRDEWLPHWTVRAEHEHHWRKP